MPADIYAGNWNEDDSSNNQTPPDGFPEGMAPSGVNNGARAIMGAAKRFVNQQIPRTTAGSATAFTLTYPVAPGGYVDGMTFRVQFHATNGVVATLNVNLLGAKPLHYHVAGAWRIAPPGLIDTDEVFEVAYHDATGAFRLVGFRNGTGRTEEFAGSVAPAGALFCNGQAVSRTDYAGLFAVIGTSHGNGNGTTTFNVPNHNNRFVLGGAPGSAGGSSAHAHNVSGSASGSLSVSAFGTTATPTDFATAVSSGGGSASTPGHVHTFSATGSASGSLGVSAGTDVQSHLPPYITENKIIRT